MTSIIEEVEELDKAEEVKEATQRRGKGGGWMKQVCYDANYRLVIMRESGVRRQPFAHATIAHPLRTSLSNAVVQQASVGFNSFGLFCRASDDGDRWILGIPDCEAAADKHGNQYGEFSGAAGGH